MVACTVCVLVPASRIHKFPVDGPSAIKNCVESSILSASQSKHGWQCTSMAECLCPILLTGGEIEPTPTHFSTFSFSCFGWPGQLIGSRMISFGQTGVQFPLTVVAHFEKLLVRWQSDPLQVHHFRVSLKLERACLCVQRG